MIATEIARPRRSLISVQTLVRHAVNLAPILLAHVGAVAALFIGGTWREWLLVPLLVYVRGVFVTAGYHRYFAHRSFKTSRLGQFILGVCCCANLQQGPLWWALYHRHHHRHSDGPGDVHSPYHGGFFWAYCGWLFVPLDPEWHYVKDLRQYRELVWLERFWQVPGLVVAALCWWLGGWHLLCIGFCVSAVLSFHGTSIVNTVGHLVGSRRYNTPDHSRNSYLLALITMGDGWHNNHHHYPHSAQAGFFWWEIDGAFRLIRLFERLGLVWGVRRVPPHKLHPSSAESSNTVAETPAPASVEP
jgi:stearoyl-CoA desaturase (delta-9 desaturase)